VGIAIFLAGIAYAVGLFLFSYLAPILERMGIRSVPRALRLRYGRTFRVVAAVIIVIALVGIYGAQLIGFGVVVVSLVPDAGISYEQAVAVAAAIVVA
jgi:SSS family solute:Na+ symporter/sodium/proline symporter